MALYIDSMSVGAVPDPRIAYAGAECVPNTRLPIALLRLCRGSPTMPAAGGPGPSVLGIVLQQIPHGHQWGERGDFNRLLALSGPNQTVHGLSPLQHRDWAAWPRPHCDVLAVSDSLWLWTACGSGPWRSSRDAVSRLADVFSDP